MAQDLYLKVVRGNPTAEELAALIMVLAARATVAAEQAEPLPTPPAWVDAPRAALRPIAPASDADAWRVSGWTR
ncbi:acyl-CoA carboxylase subunit epsilon [Sphaerisporangium fuscum]|uniref:acyl-CoA carboxylase subunit epsilon n=1 Tax=Sphaerisporangium fuscum TaxID=2835868 RepID=UPI001BDBBE34|nr:acyl-CoA carboxylase subunit epsilon [Sphaerisporangium fuscum]